MPREAATSLDRGTPEIDVTPANHLPFRVCPRVAALTSSTEADQGRGHRGSSGLLAATGDALTADPLEIGPPVDGRHEADLRDLAAVWECDVLRRPLSDVSI